ncbi:MAG: hypothetical protein WAK18_14840, partial [Nocardioidaceae bacterium]
GYTNCGEVSFSPGSPVDSGHYGVKNIKAMGTSCGKARTVAKAVENHQGGENYSQSGFACKAGPMSAQGRAYTCKKKVHSTVSVVKFLGVGTG